MLSIYSEKEPGNKNKYNSGLKDILDGVKEGKMERKNMQNNNSNPKNQLITYSIRRSVCGHKLETLQEMSSKKMAKVNDSEVKKIKKYDSNESFDNLLSISTLTEEDCVKKDKGWKIDTNKVNLIFLITLFHTAF